MTDEKKSNRPRELVDARSSEPYILIAAVFMFILLIGICFNIAFAIAN